MEESYTFLITFILAFYFATLTDLEGQTVIVKQFITMWYTIAVLKLSENPFIILALSFLVYKHI